MARKQLDPSEKNPLNQTREIRALRKQIEDLTPVATANIADDAVTFDKMQEIATDRLIGRDTAGTGNPEEVSLSGGLEFTGSGGIQRSAFSGGDVSAVAGSANLTIVSDAVTNTKLADMAASTFKGRITGSTGDPEDLTATQATSLLNTFTAALKGLTPASGGGTANFLRADGSWAAPPAGLAAASQSDQETATSNSVATTPGRQQFHPSAAKFWISGSVGAAISASYNVTSITDNGVSDWTVNIATDFSSANWCAVLGTLVSTPDDRFLIAQTQAAGSIRVNMVTGGGTLAELPGSEWFVTGYGDQ